MKKYEKMTKKELLRIARIYGIKGRSKMDIKTLIKEIEKKKIPIEKMKKFEEELKSKKLPKEHNEDFVQLLPKEPGTVFVHWETKKSGKEVVLRINEDKKNVIEIPVMSNKGNGYMKVGEGKKVNAVVGVMKNGEFKKIAESPEVLVPVSKASDNKTVKWVSVRKKRRVSKKTVPKNMEKLEEKKKNTEKAAKSVKYIKIPKER